MKYYVTHILFVDIACCVIVVADPKCCLLFVADFTLKRFFFVFLLCFVQFYLWEFQNFCFPHISCYSFGTSQFWCEQRLHHCRKSPTSRKDLISFSFHRVFYVLSVDAPLSLQLLCLLVKHRAFNYLSIYFLPLRSLFQNIGEFGAKTYFTDDRKTNTILLVAVIKENFLAYSFSEEVTPKGNPPETS